MNPDERHHTDAPGVATVDQDVLADRPPDAMSECFEPDLAQAERFIKWKSGGNPDEPQTWQLFDDKGEDIELRGVLFGPLRSQARRLVDRNRRGAGVYVMANRGDLQGRRRDNVTEVTHVFVDQDAPTEVSVYDYSEPHATIQTSTPGRLQHHWRVEGVPLEAFAPIQKGLAHTFGTDESVTDLPRVVRVPGFYHQKREPIMSRALHLDHTAAPLTLDTLVRTFPAVNEALTASHEARSRPAAPRPAPTPADLETFPRKLLEVVARKAGDVIDSGRHELLVWTARTCLDNELPQGEAEALVLQARDLLPERRSGPVPDSEVRDVVDWVFATLTPGEPWTLARSSQASAHLHGHMRAGSRSGTPKADTRKPARGVLDPQARASIFDRLRGAS